MRAVSYPIPQRLAFPDDIAFPIGKRASLNGGMRSICHLTYSFTNCFAFEMQRFLINIFRSRRVQQLYVWDALFSIN